MGRSDPIVFSSYMSMLPKKKYKRACFLGFSSGNNFTDSIDASVRYFFDISLNSWDINEEKWNIGNEYDLIVCTRCPYFSKDPIAFFKKCYDALSPGGTIFVDWGLGDHWRFPEYKVGWKKGEEQEHAYFKDNFLWSTVWHDEFLNHPEFSKFEKWVEKFGYKNVKDSIMKEVPVVSNLLDVNHLFDFRYNLLTLWEEKPQLYIMLLGEKII
jgi:SAM-dependent methyltransferase